MKIAVVHPGSGWILSKIAERMCAAMPEVFICCGMQYWPAEPARAMGISILMTPDGIYYVDVQNMWATQWREQFPEALHIGFFTHLDRDSADSFRPGWEKLDGVVHMAERYRTMFAANKWYPMDRMVLLRPGEVAAEFPLKPVTFGICQRGEHVGKGRDFLPEVIEGLPAEIKAAMRLSFLGKGWLPNDTGSVEEVQQYYGVSAYQWPEDRELYARWHQQIDYLVIPSIWEGGPMALLEAMATGTPILAAAVGWVPEFKEETGGLISMFAPGNVRALQGLIIGRVAGRLDRRHAVEGMSNRHYAEGVLSFFEAIRERKGTK